MFAERMRVCVCCCSNIISKNIPFCVKIVCIVLPVHRNLFILFAVEANRDRERGTASEKPFRKLFYLLHLPKLLQRVLRKSDGGVSTSLLCLDNSYDLFASIN